MLPKLVYHDTLCLALVSSRIGVLFILLEHVQVILRWQS